MKVMACATMTVWPLVVLVVSRWLASTRSIARGEDEAEDERKNKPLDIESLILVVARLFLSAR